MFSALAAFFHLTASHEQSLKVGGCGDANHKATWPVGQPSRATKPDAGVCPPS